MKNTINAQIVADSITQMGDRITTYLLTYPRFIHAELMTHRMFSRGSASSRAIPFKRMLQMVEEDPFIPIAWAKDHSGMQGNAYFTNKDSIEQFTATWLEASKYAVEMAEELNSSHIMDYNNPEDKRGLTKQLCNRLLEPFMWHTTLVTSTEFENFFELRCPKYVDNTIGFEHINYKSIRDWYKNTKHLGADLPTFVEMLHKGLNKSQAEIHIQALAESMWDARNESTPKILKAGEWHIPFGDKIDLTTLFNNPIEGLKNLCDVEIEGNFPATIKIATARCARLSYLNHDGKIDYGKDIQLHNQLLLDKHMSPFEHCARAMTTYENDRFYKGLLDIEEFSIATSFYESTSTHIDVLCGSGNAQDHGWCNNFKGFMQYRYLIENKLL